MSTRRDALMGALGIAAGAMAHGTASAGAADGQPKVAPKPPDLSFLRSSPLLNVERARRALERERLDAFVVTRPANVFYFSNHYPQLERMGLLNAMVAVFCREPSRPAALVAHAFNYYYSHSDEMEFSDRLIFTFTQADANATRDPAAAEEPAVPPNPLRIVDDSLVTPRERRRREALARTRSNSATAAIALGKALRELRLEKARLGIDDPSLEAALRSRGIPAECVPAEDTIRWVRLAKSPAEIELMKLAARQNREAALVAAHAVRSYETTRELRARFFSEAALRGNTGLFMVIDGSSSEVMNWPIREGMAFSIDCVSTCRHYHGDFARTIFVGEPPAQMRRATRAIGVAWDELRGQLKAGLRYSDVRRIGRESLKKQGVDYSVSFTPHSVGLFHTDHPGASMLGGRSTLDLELEENMVLSVDCPVLDAGLGGSAHLEDLMLIGRSGATPLHEIDEKVIVV